MQKIIVGLLVIVVAVLGVIAWALLRPDPRDSAERRQVERDARDGVRYSCTFGVNSLDDPAYEACLDRAGREAVDDWDAANLD